MRRLYLQVYVGFVAVALVSLVVAGVVASTVWGERPGAVVTLLEGTAALSGVPPGDPAFEQVSEELGLDVTLRDGAGHELARVGEELPDGDPGAFRASGRTGVRVALPDGRHLALAQRRGSRARFVGWLGLVALGMAIGAWPLARRITRRLEELRDGVSRWGDGDLGARVPVRGRDEVASVARAFNEAAERVQRSFEAQRRVLASASHDLRSPLARLRMALELLDDGSEDGAALVRDATRDVEELDATVGDLLQVGRMQAASGPERPVEVALRAILEEEAARLGAEVEGGERVVHGDPHLLRRLVRNLLENAARHGARPITARVRADGFEVEDRGPGVPAELRERIFEPFFRPDGHAEGRDGSVGLGLHLCREIARHHGGDVRCEPREGGGTRFRVELGSPRRPGQPAPGDTRRDPGGTVGA